MAGEWVNLSENGTVSRGQLERFLKLISFVLDEAKGLIDAFPVILDVDKTDADYLPLIADLVGIGFNYDIPIPRQREEIKRAVEVYKTKGTVPGIKRFCRNIIGINPEIMEFPKRILMSNDPNKVSAQVTTPEIIENVGLPGDQASYSLDFSLAGDYRHDKFGIYFQLGEYAGILKSVAEKILLLLSRNIPASTIGKIIFVDYPYALSSPGAYPGTIYHAFGTGEESWDSQLEQPNPSQTVLVNEIHRRIPDSIVYVDANGYATDTPTDIIRVVSILNNSESAIDGKYIREQGLFGGDATEQKDSGTLLGAVNHKGQWKANGFRIRKTLEVDIPKPSPKNYIYAGTEPDGKIFRSEDGATWEEVADTDEYIVNIIETFNGYIYAGTGNNGKIFRSEDGSNWELAATLPATIGVVALYEFNGYLYAGTYPNGKIFRSNDGINWDEVADTGEWSVLDFEVFNGYIYAGTYSNGKIFRSSNGTNWSEVNQLAETVACLKVFDGYLYAGTGPDGIIFRSNNGLSWGEAGETYEEDIGSLEVFDGHIYAATYPNMFIFRSSNGSNWYEAAGLNEEILCFEVFDGYLYAGTYISEIIYRSSDGTVWEEVGNITGQSIHCLKGIFEL